MPLVYKSCNNFSKEFSCKETFAKDTSRISKHIKRNKIKIHKIYYPLLKSLGYEVNEK